MSDAGARASAKGGKPLWLKVVGDSWAAFVPLVVGITAFTFYMLSTGTEERGQAHHTALIVPSLFRGIDFVYGMLVASLVTVLVGTLLYLFELHVMMLRAQRIEERTRVGRSQQRNAQDKQDTTRGDDDNDADTTSVNRIGAAFLMLVIAIFIDVALLVMILFYNVGATSGEACDLEKLLVQTKYHDGAVGLVFVTFVIADALTYYGMRKAISNASRKDKDCKHAQSDKDFAKQQLFLIDVPVLIGAIISVIIVLFAAGLNDWASNAFRLSRDVQEFMSVKKLTTVFVCEGKPLSLPEFQESIVRIFAAGIAMGYLAAHVLMSQIVFVTLTVLHKLRQKEESLP